MHRRIAALGVVAAAALALAACAGPAASAPTVLTVQLIDDATADAYRTLLGTYDDAHPDVRIVVRTSSADDIRDRLGTELGRTGLGDLVTVRSEWLPSLFAYSDLLTAVPRTTLGRKDQERWPSWVVKDATDPAGRVVGYASGIAPRAVCYDPELLAAAGLPSDREAFDDAVRGDWTELLGLASQYTAATGRPMIDSADVVYEAMIGQLKAPYENPTTGEVTATTNPAVRTAFDRLTADISVFAGVVPGTSEWMDAAASGAFAVSLCAGGTSGPAAPADGAPVEAGDGTLAALVGQGWQVADVFPAGGGSAGTTYFSIPSGGSHVGQTAALADWLTAPDQQATLYAAAGIFPSAAVLHPSGPTATAPAPAAATPSPTPTSETPTDIYTTPLGELLAERAAATTVDRFRGPASAEIDDAMRAALERVRLGAVSADTSWAEWVAAVETIP